MIPLDVNTRTQNAQRNKQQNWMDYSQNEAPCLLACFLFLAPPLWGLFFLYVFNMKSSISSLHHMFTTCLFVFLNMQTIWRKTNFQEAGGQVSRFPPCPGTCFDF